MKMDYESLKSLWLSKQQQQEIQSSFILCFVPLLSASTLELLYCCISGGIMAFMWNRAAKPGSCLPDIKVLVSALYPSNDEFIFALASFESTVCVLFCTAAFKRHVYSCRRERGGPQKTLRCDEEDWCDRGGGGGSRWSELIHLCCNDGGYKWTAFTDSCILMNHLKPFYISAAIITAHYLLCV